MIDDCEYYLLSYYSIKSYDYDRFQRISQSIEDGHQLKKLILVDRKKVFASYLRTLVLCCKTVILVQTCITITWWTRRSLLQYFQRGQQEY